MTGVKIITEHGQEIKFEFYLDEAPLTSKEFIGYFRLHELFIKSIRTRNWIDNVPQLDIIQENASVFTIPGEVVFGPTKPIRTKTANCFGYITKREKA